jgi:HlyD family secretion protein
VVLTLEQTDAPLRPDLSATAEIVVETSKQALGVPIIAMTVREDSLSAQTEGETEESREVEGVFVVNGDRVTFTPVQIGIAGQEYFEVLSGLSEGDTVVAGPYQRIRQLVDGDQIIATDEPGTGD